MWYDECIKDSFNYTAVHLHQWSMDLHYAKSLIHKTWLSYMNKMMCILVNEGEFVQYLIGATEQRLTRVHLHQNAAQGPHVYGQIIRHPQQHLWGPVEPALDVLVDLWRTKEP